MNNFEEKLPLYRILIRYLFTFSFLIWLTTCAGQTPSDSTLAADCSKAKKISVLKTYTSPVAPDSTGDVLEFDKESEKSLHFFEQEHNTAWYTFSIPADGHLGFDIIPENIKDDYDFVLYKYDGKGFCERLKDKTILPVRTCISRNDTTIRSLTGLNDEAKAEFIHSGPGASYSKSIDVTTGDVYVLVLDNVYPDGGRHKIRFHYGKTVAISGEVRNKDSGMPLNANVIVEDILSGEEVAETMTNPVTGQYSLSTILDYTREYDVVAYADSFVFSTEAITDEEIRADSGFVINLQPEPVEPGRNYKIEGVNFEPNTPVFAPGSQQRAMRILKFMRKNQNIHILIEGHTNCAGNSYGPTTLDQPLSEARAKRVFDILIKGKIAANRLEMKGFGCTRMLCPQASALPDQMKNMRVEIKITKY